MKTLNVLVKPNPYKIFIDEWNLNHSLKQILSFLKEDRLFIITNTTIQKLYRKKLSAAFDKHFQTIWIAIGDGEKYKNLSTVEKVLLKLSQKNATRGSTLLALGGGVVGDIAGFVAATYMRGINYIQMPTTLLSQVDSSVGGKTGVDLPTGKNLVGSFYQPKAVLIHTDFLKTLPKRELLCGMAEVIKYGVIWDKAFFTYLQKNKAAILKLSSNHLKNIIHRSCAIKAEVVKRDEKESSIRAILNYGHTLGHAIEALSGFSRIKHGEAVAIGMCYAARLADQGKYSQKPLEQSVKDLVKLYNLPTKWPKYTKKQYIQVMQRDKKSTKNAIKFIMPVTIGKVEIISLPAKEIVQWL